jgi:hypothetical protein
MKTPADRDARVGDHAASMRARSDVGGLVFFASCTCGWLGPNHPSSIGAAEASQRATADMHAHLRSTVTDN